MTNPASASGEEESVVSAAVKKAPEELLREKDVRIGSLERQKRLHEEQLVMLRSELGTMQIKHKEETYWLRLEVDNLRRDKEATEDRMEELYRDLRELDVDEDSMGGQVCVDSSYVLHLQSQLNKSMQTMGILDNQISMVKSSCDEVVKSLKDEIADVMDDKCRMEMELMNQLSVLDNEKHEMELEFEEHIRLKDDEVDRVKEQCANPSAAAAATTNGEKAPTAEPLDAGKEEELQNEISALTEEKEKLQEELNADRTELGEHISTLKEENAELMQRVESLSSDLEVMGHGSAAEALQVLDILTRDREETLTSLERVALIWEKADDSTQGLEEVMEKLCPNEGEEEDGKDREQALSTLEAAILLHGQIKVSLLLIELKLRNQLASLKNDKLRMDSAGALTDESVHEVLEKAKEIEEEALRSVAQVEDKLSRRAQQLHEESRTRDSEMLNNVEEKAVELAKMKSEHKKLEEEVEKLRAAGQKHNGADASNTQPKEAKANDTSLVSRATLEKLQREVIGIVDRVKEKNETIARLTSSIEEQKVREAALKKEMKRMMKRSRADDEESANMAPPAGHQRSNRRNSVVRTPA